MHLGLPKSVSAVFQTQSPAAVFQDIVPIVELKKQTQKRFVQPLTPAVSNKMSDWCVRKAVQRQKGRHHVRDIQTSRPGATCDASLLLGHTMDAHMLAGLLQHCGD